MKTPTLTKHHGTNTARYNPATSSLVTVEDVVKGLLRETGEDVAGSTHSGRVAAWKQLGEHTGGFDTNRQKVDVNGEVIFNLQFSSNEESKG